METISEWWWLLPAAAAYMMLMVAVFTPLGMLLGYIGAISLCFYTGHWMIGTFWVALPAWCLWGKG